MMDTCKMEFEKAASVEELRKKIPADAQGPVFRIGDRITLRGMIWEVSILDRRGMFLKPIELVETRQARRLRERQSAAYNIDALDRLDRHS